MRYTLICIGFFIVLLNSCRTIKEIDFIASENSPWTELPSLEATVDFDSLSRKISYGKIKVSGYYNAVIKVKEHEERTDSIHVIIEDEGFSENMHRENPEYYRTEVVFVPEVRVYDIIKLFSKEVYGNGTKNDTNYVGSVDLELLSFNDKKSIGLVIFSIWTFCVPSLVGVPINKVKTDLEIKVSVLDKNNLPIKSYTAKGNGNAFIALYWGYGEDAWRKSAINAFHDAFQSINLQIKADKELLRLKLGE